MPTPRKPTAPTTAAIDQFCAAFDDLLGRYEERTALRQYLIGLLLPREHNKTLVELAAIVPGARRQALQHFLHDAPWDAEALNRRRLQQWQAHPVLGPHAGGVLIVDETGDPKRGHRSVLAAQQYLGKRGHVANGVVAVTSHWTDGSRHVPLGVRPYRPASRLPNGKRDPAFHTKPQLAWELIQEAQAAGIPFRLVVADSIYGEGNDLENHLFAAGIPYIMGLRPSHGTWQLVEDPRHPPAFTPAEAAQRLPRAAWQRTVRFDSHGKELVRSIAELELGRSDGPTRPVRLIAATLADCRDAGSAAAQARVDVVPGDLLPPCAGQRRAGLRTLPPARLDRALLQAGPTCARLVRLPDAHRASDCAALAAGAAGLHLQPAGGHGAHRASRAGCCCRRPCVLVRPRVDAWGKTRRPSRHHESCGRPRSAGCGAGSAPGHSCSALGNSGRTAPHRPSWPRCSPTSPAPCLLRPPRPRPDQPAPKWIATETSG